MILFLASLLLLLMFLLAGFNKLFNLQQTANYLKNKVNFNVSNIFYILAILIVIIIQIGCSSYILYYIYNDKYNEYVNYSIYSIIGFTILATLIFHFPPIGKDYYSLMSNLSTIGGLLLLSQFVKKNIYIIDNGK
jgi:uncharacterized membrane protein YphA (DoxX/SURF4 family)